MCREADMNQTLAQVTLIDEIAKVFLEEVILELGLKGEVWFWWTSSAEVGKNTDSAKAQG